MVKKHSHTLLICLVALPLAFAQFSMLGCSREAAGSFNPELMQSLKSKWTLAEEPSGAITTLDLRDMIDEGIDAPEKVVFVGNVGGMPNPWPGQFADFPWVKNTATFFLVDPSVTAEFACHLGDGDIEDLEAHAEECPFCAREAANQSRAIAAISFVDEEGNPHSVGIQELFGFNKGDVVVVEGTIDQINDGLILVNADGVYRREN